MKASKLNYESCKQLKKAGFPQEMGDYLVKGPSEEGDYRGFQITEPLGYENLLRAGYDMVFVPTLSQLIEAIEGAKYVKDLELEYAKRYLQKNKTNLE